MQAGCSMILVLMLMANSLLLSHPPVWAVRAQHICARQEADADALLTHSDLVLLDFSDFEFILGCKNRHFSTYQ